MVLPKLNTTPKYEMKIPSTGVTIRFRPYLVKEESILLLAMESKDPRQILNAIADTVLACIDDEVDKNKLTSFDVEFMFVKIRAKSVGERAQLEIPCQECKHPNVYTLDLDSMGLDIYSRFLEESDPVIHLTDDITLKMHVPSYVSISNSSALDESLSDIEKTFVVVSQFIEFIQSGEDSILVRDEPEADVVDFIKQMTSEQYKMLREYIESVPTLKHTIEFECEKCSASNKIELEGMNDFF